MLCHCIIEHFQYPIGNQHIKVQQGLQTVDDSGGAPQVPHHTPTVQSQNNIRGAFFVFVFFFFFRSFSFHKMPK